MVLNHQEHIAVTWRYASRLQTASTEIAAIKTRRNRAIKCFWLIVLFVPLPDKSFHTFPWRQLHNYARNPLFLCYSLGCWNLGPLKDVKWLTGENFSLAPHFCISFSFPLVPHPSFLRSYLLSFIPLISMFCPSSHNSTPLLSVPPLALSLLLIFVMLFIWFSPLFPFPCGWIPTFSKPSFLPINSNCDDNENDLLRFGTSLQITSVSIKYFASIFRTEN